jgi:hypothetical protein
MGHVGDDEPRIHADVLESSLHVCDAPGMAIGCHKLSPTLHGVPERRRLATGSSGSIQHRHAWGCLDGGRNGDGRSIRDDYLAGMGSPTHGIGCPSGYGTSPGDARNLVSFGEGGSGPHPDSDLGCFIS